MSTAPAAAVETASSTATVEATASTATVEATATTTTTVTTASALRERRRRAQECHRCDCRENKSKKGGLHFGPSTE